MKLLTSTDRLGSNNSTSSNLSLCITASITRCCHCRKSGGACFANVTFTRSSWRRNQEEQQEKLIAFARGEGTVARRNRRPSNKSTCLVLIRLRSRASVQNEISPWHPSHLRPRFYFPNARPDNGNPLHVFLLPPIFL